MNYRRVHTAYPGFHGMIGKRLFLSAALPSGNIKRQNGHKRHKYDEHWESGPPPKVYGS